MNLDMCNLAHKLCSTTAPRPQTNHSSSTRHKFSNVSSITFLHNKSIGALISLNFLSPSNSPRLAWLPRLSQSNPEKPLATLCRCDTHVILNPKPRNLNAKTLNPEKRPGPSTLCAATHVCYCTPLYSIVGLFRRRRPSLLKTGKAPHVT